MKCIALTTLISLFFLPACLNPSKDKPKPGISDEICVMNKVVSKDADSSYNYVIVYNYDSAGRIDNRKFYLHDWYINPINPATDAVETQFTYDGNGILISTNTSDYLWTEVVYSGNNVSELLVHQIENDDTVNSVYRFTVQGDKITQIKLTEDGIDMGTVFSLTYDGLNLDKVEQYRNASLVEWHEYDSYDDTINYQKVFLPELFAGHPEISHFIYLSENNPLHRKNGLDQPTSGWFLDYNHEINNEGKLQKTRTEDHWSDVIVYFYSWLCS